MATNKIFFGLSLIIAMTLGVALAVPVDDPSAAEAALPAKEVAITPTTPEVVATPAQSAPSPAAVPAAEQGGGYITEHKNPDGSTLTITRFNGPLPSSAFPGNPFGNIQQQILQSHLNNVAQIYGNLAINKYPPFLYPSYNYYNVLPNNIQTFSYPYQNFPYTFTTNPALGASPFGSPFTSPYFYPWGYPAIGAVKPRTA